MKSLDKRFFHYALNCLWVVSISSASADLVASGTQDRTFPPFGGWGIDVNGDGVDDFDIREVTIATTDVPSSSSTTRLDIRGLGSNLILSSASDNPTAICLDTAGADLPIASRWAGHWITIARSGSQLVRGSDPVERIRIPWTAPWAEKGSGYLLGAFEAVDGLHAVWFQMSFPDQSQGSPLIVDWHYDTEILSVDPTKIVPRIRSIVRSEFEQGLCFWFDRLIPGHLYVIETTTDLSADNWKPCEDIVPRSNSDNATLDFGDQGGTRFFRVRHEWRSSFSQ